jgi:hypothetical protein
VTLEPFTSNPFATSIRSCSAEIASSSGRSGLLAAGTLRERRENCEYPPGRCMNMPELTPAGVRKEPSRTNRTSLLTRTDGYDRPNCSILFQWVVARRPSSAPAWAGAPGMMAMSTGPRSSGLRPACSVIPLDGLAALPSGETSTVS